MLKKTIFYTLFFLISFFVFELFIRTIIFLNVKNFDIYSYGFKNNIDFQVRSLKKFDFILIDNDFLKSTKIESIKKNSNNIHIWVYGGSTSDVACRKENKSAWPKNLEKIDKNIKVKNFARSGTNSDFALNSLISASNDKKQIKPDIILWANYVNETDVLSLGFKRNKFLEKNLDINRDKNKFIYNLHAISLTLKKYSISFIIFDRFLSAVLRDLPGPPFENFTYPTRSYFTENELGLASENYKINTLEAIKVSTLLNADFYIITLFAKYDYDKNDKNQNIKKRIFLKKIDEITKIYPQIDWINLKEHNFGSREIIDDLFCDNIHLTELGNNEISKLVYKKLRFNSID